MSVWRIPKVDAQTRILAEAAAKAAGLPLGAWLERAILRRVEGPTTPTQAMATDPTEPTAAKAPAKPEISSEMQAALDAAERRRRDRIGENGKTAITPVLGGSSEPAGNDSDLADPFAAPEKTSDDSPFEGPPDFETGSSDTAGLRIEDDETISLATEPGSATDEVARNDDALTQPGDGLPLPPLGIDANEGANQSGVSPAARAGYPPSWEESKAPPVTTTARESLVLPKEHKPSRAPSSLPLILGGLLVILAASGAAYVFLIDVDQPPPVASSPPSPELSKPVAQAAAPPPPAPTAPAPQASVPTPADTTPAAPANAASAMVPPSAPPTLPQTGGPSIVNMALGDAAQTQPPSAAVAPPQIAAAPPSSPAVASQQPAANEALPALSARAEAGDLEAQVELGRRYIQGIGVGRNEVEAGKWLLRAAEQGHAQAQFNVGVMYERGVGLENNLTKAIEFYRKAAAQNTPMALHNLGLLYVSGQPGIKADPAQARRLMTQAAELGQVESQYSLALMHLQGVGGPVDKVTAMAWMSIAARPNQPQLIEAAKQLLAQLSPAERQRAQQLAETTVRRVQANLQRLQTASIGPQTATATPKPAPPTTPRVIDRAAIAEMQKMLASLKIYSGAADGAMGPRTAAAIREFQAMAGMPVDGKPSIELFENLRDVAGLSKQ